MKRQENIPVFMVTNWDMVGYTATTMVSVLCNTQRNIDFYIMDCGLSDFDKKQLSTLKNKFSNLSSMSFSKVDIKRFEGMNVWYYGMLDAWAMLLFPEAFPDVKKVVHIESDTLVVDDIAKLYNEDLDNYTLGGCPEIAFGATSELFPSKEHVYFNLGMLLIDCDKWRQDNTTEKCLELGKKYGKKFNCLHQDALNMLYYNNNYKQLPNRYNLGERKNYVKNIHPELSEEYFAQEWQHPVIIHFSPNKPWRTQHSFYDSKRIVKYFNEWWFYANQTPYVEGLKNAFIAQRIEDGFKGLKTGIDNYGCSMLDTLPQDHNCANIMGENVVVGQFRVGNSILSTKDEKHLMLPIPSTVKYTFLGIPFLKVKTNKKGGKSYKLFGILPLITIKRKSNGSERYKLLSIIPILTKKVK